MDGLRPYQLRAIEDLRANAARGLRRQVLVSPTGSGKTTIAADIIRSAVAKGKRALFVAHRQELVLQASARLDREHVPHGLIMAGYPAHDAPVQVASVQTLLRRDKPPADVVIIDECHHVTATSYANILLHYQHAVAIGLTATPFRTDGAGLGHIFQAKVTAATVPELESLGFLVPARYWAPPTPDTDGIPRRGGDFDSYELYARWGQPQVIGDVVYHYRKLGGDRQAICFAVNVAHSQQLAAAFRDAGIPAEHLDGETPSGTRARILADLAAGTIRVVTNCGILSEGFDCPQVSAVILSRPTASLGLHLQQIGRVLRPCHGKRDSIVLDHAGNTLRHGIHSQVIDADLTAGATGQAREAVSLRTCRNCYAVLPATAKECPCCWAKLTPPPRKVRTSDGTLVEIRSVICPCGCHRTEKRHDPEHGTGEWCQACGAFIRWCGRIESPAEYYRRQAELCRERGWKQGRADILFMSRFGRWPSRAEKGR